MTTANDDKIAPKALKTAHFGIMQFFIILSLAALAGSIYISYNKVAERKELLSANKKRAVIAASASTGESFKSAREAGYEKLKSGVDYAKELIRLAGGIRVAETNQNKTAAFYVGRQAVRNETNPEIPVPVIDKSKSIIGADFSFYSISGKGAELLTSTHLSNGLRASGKKTITQAKDAKLFYSMNYGRPYIRKETSNLGTFLAFYEPLKLKSGKLVGILKADIPLKFMPALPLDNEYNIFSELIGISSFEYEFRNLLRNDPVEDGTNSSPDQNQLKAMVNSIESSSNSEPMYFEIALIDGFRKTTDVMLVSVIPVPQMDAAIVTTTRKGTYVQSLSAADFIIPASILLILFSGLLSIREVKKSAGRQIIQTDLAIQRIASELGIEAENPSENDILRTIEKIHEQNLSAVEAFEAGARSIGESVIQISGKLGESVDEFNKFAAGAFINGIGVKINLEILRDELPRTAVGFSRAINIAGADLKKLLEDTTELSDMYRKFGITAKNLSYSALLSTRIKNTADRIGSVSLKLNSFNINSELREENELSVEERIRMLIGESRKLAFELDIIAIELGYFTREFETIMQKSVKEIEVMEITAGSGFNSIFRLSNSALKTVDELSRLHKEMNVHYLKISDANDSLSLQDKNADDKKMAFASYIGKLHNLRIEIAERFHDYIN